VRGLVDRQRAWLFFVCRIGHSYGLAEVLAAKEERLENRLWTVVTAAEELAALLKDLHGRSGSSRARAEVCAAERSPEASRR
jgi:hypothetical protein